MAKQQRSQKQEKKSLHANRDMTPIWGLLLFTAAVVMLLSLLSFAYSHSASNWMGLTGFTIGRIFHAVFGLGSYFFCFFLGWMGWRLMFSKSIQHIGIKTLYLFVFVSSICVLLSLIEDNLPDMSYELGNLFYSNLWQRKLHYHLGGASFYYLYRDLPFVNLLHIFNATGIAIIFSSTMLASFLFLAKINPIHVIQAIVQLFPKKDYSEEEEFSELEAVAEEPVNNSRFVKVRIPDEPASVIRKELPQHLQQELLEIQPETELTVRPSLSQKALSDIKKNPSSYVDSDFTTQKKKEKETKNPPSQPHTSKKQTAVDAQRVHNGDFTGFKMPPLTLLTSAKKIDQSSIKQDLRRQAEVLEETLLSFGIEAKVGQINCGPTINSFEVHPAIGVKVQKIKALENDIALNMEAKSIRIIAPIPGKAAVGIEVPNPQPQEVAFKEMLTAYQQGGKKFHIPVLLGKAVNGDFVMSDLTKMPHCIIAGATGSGKSVCINTIVMAILLNAKPDEIKLIMVDPKKVELTPYTRLPHMLAPVITEPQGACAALNWLVKEMERRYEILKLMGVRNIEAFNKRTINKDFEASLGSEIPASLPYIVLIIDELADLMMVSSNDIETPIARIAQMARAIGIHMILATQRPSREVITGLIKANFPTRISFKVASRVNSQIILDESGSEALLGNGDMLFLPPGTSTLVRAQGAYIRDEDIASVVKHICDQAPPNYVIASFDALGVEATQQAASAYSTSDSLYDQAKQIVITTGNASTTFLQRKLKIGYARAASLIDELEQHGIVGPAEGSKPRKVLNGTTQSDSALQVEKEEWAEETEPFDNE